MAALKTNSPAAGGKKGREGGNLPEWGIDFVWPQRVLHSWSWQQESSETCFTNRRAKAPMQNYFLTAPGNITHSCAPFFLFFLSLPFHRWHNTFQPLVAVTTTFQTLTPRRCHLLSARKHALVRFNIRLLRTAKDFPDRRPALSKPFTHFSICAAHFGISG